MTACPGSLCEADLVPKPGVVDNAVYVGGERVDSPPTLEQTYDLQKRRDGLAWIGLYRPSDAMIHSVAHEFDLHHLMVEDAIVAHQRPKLERYGTTLFTVLRPARYLDEEEEVEFGELHVITGPDFVVTIRHAERPDLARVRQRLERSPALLCQGPEAILYSILDQVVDDYSPVVAGMENDIDEIEKQLFDGDPTVSQRIYLLMGEVMDFQRAVKPLVSMMENLARGFEKYRVDIELQRNLRDVQDHVLRIVEQIDGFRTLLQNALSVDATLTAQRQNEETKRLTETSLEQGDQMKRVSSWAAILFAPSLIGGIYGMNFDHMPETHWRFGYPMALGMMLALALILYMVFRRKGWL
jgi:magnesium transporter